MKGGMRSLGLGRGILFDGKVASYGGGYANLVLASAPIGYYRHESGALGVDSSGGGNDMAPVTCTADPGIIGGSGWYNGTYYQQHSLAGPWALADLALGSNIVTAEFFMSANQAPSANFGLVFAGNYSGGTSRSGWSVFMEIDGRIKVMQHWGTTLGQFHSTNVVISAYQTWYHVVAVVQGNSTSASGVRKLYINGNSVSITHLADPAGVETTDSGRNIDFGRMYNATSGYTHYLIGHLDEVAIYNRELTSSEVSSHFAASGL